MALSTDADSTTDTDNTPAYPKCSSLILKSAGAKKPKPGHLARIFVRPAYCGKHSPKMSGPILKNTCIFALYTSPLARSKFLHNHVSNNMLFPSRVSLRILQVVNRVHTVCPQVCTACAGEMRALAGNIFACNSFHFFMS